MEKVKILFEEYFEAPRLIKKLKLGWGYLVGGLIGALLLILFYFISGYIGIWVFNKLNVTFNFQEYIGFFRWIVILLIRVVILSIEYFFFRTILLALLAPFFSYVSERVESYQEGSEYNFTLKENIGFIVRGMKIASKSFLKEIFYTAIIILLGAVPVINIVVPGLIYIVQSYFISYNFVDYTLERRNFSADQSSEFMWKNKVVFTIGGGIFTLIYFIPVVGIMIAPIISIVTFTSVTLKILKNEKKSNLKNQIST